MKHIKTGKERTKEDLSALRKTVSEIIEDVIANGDTALRSYSEKFDGFAPSRISRESRGDRRCLFPRQRTGTRRYEVCAR